MNNDKRSHFKKNVKIKRRFSKGCFIQDTYIICGGTLENRVELLKFEELKQMRIRRKDHFAFQMENFLNLAGGYGGSLDKILDSCKGDTENNDWFYLHIPCSMHQVARILLLV